MAIGDLDALSQRPQVIATIAVASEPYALASRRGELPHHRGRDGLLPGAFKRGGHPLRFSLRLVTDRFEAGNAVLERRVVQVCHAAFDGVVKPLESQVGLCGALMQLGDVLAAALGSFLAAVENGCQHFLKPFRLKQPVRDMTGNEVVELLHRDRAALAAGIALPGLDGAGVVAVAPALSGPERHGAAACGTEADAGKEGGAADNTRRRDLWVAGAEMRLHGVEGRPVDQRRHFGRHDLAGRLCAALRAGPVELVLADVGRSGQHTVNLPDAPAPPSRVKMPRALR